MTTEPLTRDELLEQCDPRFMAALTRWRNGPLPDVTRTLGRKWVWWIGTHCKLGEGDRRGLAPLLTPEQQALLWKIGEVTSAGRMRFRAALISLGKGGGKTPFGGWMGSLALRGPRVVCPGCAECDGGWLPDGRPHGVARHSPDVMIMASTHPQADMILSEIKVTFEGADGVDITQPAVIFPGVARARRIPATPKQADGSKSTDLLVDEFHEFDAGRHEEAYEVAAAGTAKREDGLVCLLSTAGDDLNTIWGRIVSRAKRGEFGADELAVIMEADEGLNPLDDDDVAEGIRQANPLARRGIANTGALVKQFRDMPLYRALRFFWNRWTSVDAAWLPTGAWDACRGEVLMDPSLPTWVGVDMALKRDSAAIVMVQRRPDGRLQTSARIWLPLGELVDQTECDDYLRAIAGAYNLQWIAADQAWWATLGTLEAEGLPIFRMPQQGRNMIVAYSMTYRAIVDGILVHDGAPDYSDQIASAVPQSSDRGWTLRKGKARRRIDSCPALAGAIFATEQPVEEQEKPQQPMWVV